MGNERLLVRECRLEDCPAVLELWAGARSRHAITPDRSGDVERLVAETPSFLLVAEVSGELIGVLIAAWDGWRGNMYRLTVRAENRRQGVAKELVRAGEDQLRRKGARRVTALVAYDDPIAAAFWDAARYPSDAAIGRRVRNI